MSVSLQPSSTLGFPRPLTQTVKRSLTISNNNVQPVAFKVKTTAPKLYCVRPNSGRVEPGQTVEVQVMLQAMKEEPPLAAKCKDKFLIQSTTITPEKETLSLADIWNTTDGDTHQQKIRVSYLPPEGTNIPEEEEPAPGPPVQPSLIDTPEQHHSAAYFANGHGPQPIPESDPQFEETREEAEPAPVVNVAVHHPPPRQQTPQPFRDRDLNEKLAEATAEINNLRTLLASMPGPTAKDELHSEPSGMRKRHHRSPSTVAGTETDVSTYVDEPYQPDGVPLQIVIIIALGVFVTTYLFF